MLKNTSLLAIIASLLLTASLIQPGLAGMTTLTAPDITDPTKTPGCPEFWVDISITDAANLWGYMFTLRYDTTVLTATGHKSHPIFMMPEPSEINDEEGYIAIAYHMPFGAPVGFTGSLPNLASIKFAVDDLGASQLEITNAKLSDPLGKEVPAILVAGSFRNVVGAPMANFDWAPEEPIEGEVVTFASTSTDPDGLIVSCDWSFGDGSTGTGVTETNRYSDPGTYTVTLTVTDNDGKTDSCAKAITVAPKPLKKVGARLQIAECTEPLLDLSTYGFDQLNTFRALVKNLNQKEETLVRVVFFVYTGGMNPLGSIEMDWQWLRPNHPTWFTTDFNYADWDFVGPEMGYIVITHVYYMDYYILPGQPHWVETERMRTFSFLVTETAPVPVYTWTDNEDGSVTLDASASYDPDEIWGDYIIDYTWRIYDRWPYWMFSGVTVTKTPDPYGADDYYQDETGDWHGIYYCRLYVTDSLMATSVAEFNIDIHVPGYVPPPP